METPAIQRVVVVLAGITCVVGLSAGVLLASRGAQVRPPGKWESQIVTLAKHRFLVGNKDLKNPLSANHELAADGQHTFANYCYVCHGLDGQNTGVPFAKSMSPPVPSLASKDVQNYTDGQLFWVIKNGLWPSGMPASRGILTDEEIWSIVIYIRNLPRAGSLGEPRAFSGEDSASTER